MPLDGEICDRLGLLPMYAVNQDKHGTAYTVTVDAKRGVGTGISASDRATTMRLLADPTSIAEEFTRPGHVVPLRAKDGGVLRRPGHTEAAVDLARLAGLQPAGAICEIVSQKDEGAMAQTDELRVFADEHGLAMITIADIIEWRRKHEKHIKKIAEARIPTRHGEFRAIGYSSIIASHPSMGTGALVPSAVEPPAWQRASVSPDPMLNGPQYVFVRLRKGVSLAAGRAGLQRIATAANNAINAAPQAEGGRLADLQVQVGGVLVHHQLQQVVHLVAHGRARSRRGPGFSWRRRR